MRIPLIDLKQQYRSVRKPLNHAFKKIIDSQRFILSDYGRDLEASVVKKIGCKYAVGLASGSDALYLALAALGIGPGDEVITTPFSFFATAGSISRAGARPVFTDIDPLTFNLDPNQLEKKITRKTKAILPVHLFGLSAEMDRILSIAQKHGLPVVEDAAQSFGATWNDHQTGSIGEVGCFSFYPTKNLGGSGDGGMLITSSESIAKKVRVLRDHGATQKYYHEYLGINSRLDEFQAATVLAKMPWIDRWSKARAKHAEFYNKNLKGLPIQLPVTPSGYEHVYHQYSIVTTQREALKEHLHSRGIGCGVYYPLSLHLQPCYKSLGYKAGSMPVSERISASILSIPMYAELTPAMTKSVCQAIRSFFNK